MTFEEAAVADLTGEEIDAWTKILASKIEARRMMAEASQARIAAACERIEWSSIEGVGQLTMKVDPIAYHHWGQRLGYDCWGDPEFRREFRRDNPGTRVKYTPRKTTIVNQFGSPVSAGGAVSTHANKAVCVPVSECVEGLTQHRGSSPGGGVSARGDSSGAKEEAA